MNNVSENKKDIPLSLGIISYTLMTIGILLFISAISLSFLVCASNGCEVGMLLIILVPTILFLLGYYLLRMRVWARYLSIVGLTGLFIYSVYITFFSLVKYMDFRFWIGLTIIVATLGMGYFLLSKSVKEAFKR